MPSNPSVHPAVWSTNYCSFSFFHPMARQARLPPGTWGAVRFRHRAMSSIVAFPRSDLVRTAGFLRAWRRRWQHQGARRVLSPRWPGTALCSRPCYRTGIGITRYPVSGIARGPCLEISAAGGRPKRPAGALIRIIPGPSGNNGQFLAPEAKHSASKLPPRRANLPRCPLHRTHNDRSARCISPCSSP